MKLKSYYYLFGILFAFILISMIRLENFYACIHDDYYIFLRYADNLINGYGFVFNPQGEKVEGFSSFLYLLVVTMIRSFGITNHQFIPYLGIIFSSLTILYLFLLLQKTKSNININLLIMFLLVVNPIFIFNSTTGMDTALFTFLTIATIFYFIKYNYELNLSIFFLLTLLILARLESFIILFSIIFFAFIKSKFMHNEIELNRNIFMYIIYSSFLLVSMTVLRELYFGSITPNTLRAKTGININQFIGGIKYSYESYRVIFGGVSILLMFPLIYSLKKIKNDQIILISFLLILIYTSAIIIVGGDHFELGRYFMPILPFIIILIGKGLEELLKLFKKKYIQFIIVFLFLSLTIYKAGKTFAYTNPFEIIYHSKGDLNSLRFNSKNINNKLISDNRIGMLTFKEMGETLHKFNNNNSIACVPIGAIGYFSKLRIFDMVGLIEKEIAIEPFEQLYISTWRPGHDKGDGNYILSKKPDFIQLTDYFTKFPQPEPGEIGLKYKSIFEIWNSKEFHKNYEFYPIHLDNGWYYNLYKKK